MDRHGAPRARSPPILRAEHVARNDRQVEERTLAPYSHVLGTWWKPSHAGARLSHHLDKRSAFHRIELCGGDARVRVRAHLGLEARLTRLIGRRADDVALVRGP